METQRDRATAKIESERGDRGEKVRKGVSAGGVMAGAEGGAATLWRLQRRDAPLMLAACTHAHIRVHPLVPTYPPGASPYPPYTALPSPGPSTT